MLFLDLFNPWIKSTWYDIFQDVLLKCFTLVFSRVYNNIKSTSQGDENIMILSVFSRESILRIPSSAWRKARYLISTSANLVADVMIRAIPRYRPICALLNQFCSLLWTRTPISLRLNSSDFLPLETFNKEDIFICSSFFQKHFPYPVNRNNKEICLVITSFTILTTWVSFFLFFASCTKADLKNGPTS